MAGRRPTPTVLKQLAGNPGKRPLNGREPQPRRRTPKAPAHLGEKARAEWRRLVRILKPMGILTEAEADLLAVYCDAYGRWVEATRALETNGLVEYTEKGYPVLSPWLAVHTQSVKVMQRCMGELGLTPAARSRLTAAGEEEEDPLEALLKR